MPVIEIVEAKLEVVRQLTTALVDSFPTFGDDLTVFYHHTEESDSQGPIYVYSSLISQDSILLERIKAVCSRFGEVRTPFPPDERLLRIEYCGDDYLDFQYIKDEFSNITPDIRFVNGNVETLSGNLAPFARIYGPDSAKLDMRDLSVRLVQEFDVEIYYPTGMIFYAKGSPILVS